MQLALSCRAPLGAAPCADPAALRGCCGGAVSAAPSRAPLYRELPQELQRPTQRPVELSSLPFFFSGGGSCRKDRTRPPPVRRGCPAAGGPSGDGSATSGAVAAQPGHPSAALPARPTPISPQRYLKGLVDISRVGWAVWVGFPVLEVSCSRPSPVPPSRPGPALPAPEGPASSRLPPLGLDLHSDV